LDLKKNTALKKGIFHLHSISSYDSFNSINKIISFTKSNELDFVVLTDHDTIKGSQKLFLEIKKRNLDIEVPISAEYKTEFGDVIAMFIFEEINFLTWEDFRRSVKMQGGILILPHPFDGHRNLDYLAEQVDVIEVFNSRSSTYNNFKSLMLAKKLNKPMIFSSDSHIPATLGNVLLSYDSKFSLREAILSNNIFPTVLKRSNYIDFFLSQIKKALYFKDIKLFFYVIYTYFRRILKIYNHE
jgi:predicted metal-dependent phosphoesterase TrpH